LLDDVSRLISVQANAKNLTLNVTVARGVPDWLEGDAGRLRQILINLCGNAIKFTQAGQVDLDVRGEPVESGHAVIRFAVRDTGIGIPANRLQTLFKPFSQVDASTTRKYGGTGLGLSIVKRLAEMMGGEAGVKSRENVGSTFWFTARLSIASAPAITEDGLAQRILEGVATRSEAGTKYCILLAEDNAVNEMVARRALERLGYQVDCVSDGRAAVEAWGRRQYDLILMDCQMPELDGYEATREIRARESDGQHIPIVALTAHAMRGDDIKCKAAGMDDHLTKPLDRSELDRCLSRHLRSKDATGRIASSRANAG
jgi:CheY-like chemotaxis protein